MPFGDPHVRDELVEEVALGEQADVPGRVVEDEILGFSGFTEQFDVRGYIHEGRAVGNTSIGRVRITPAAVGLQQLIPQKFHRVLATDHHVLEFQGGSVGFVVSLHQGRRLVALAGPQPSDGLHEQWLNAPLFVARVARTSLERS